MRWLVAVHYKGLVVWLAPVPEGEDSPSPVRQYTHFIISASSYPTKLSTTSRFLLLATPPTPREPREKKTEKLADSSPPPVRLSLVSAPTPASPNDHTPRHRRFIAAAPTGVSNRARKGREEKKRRASP
ncbi:hypothetical protein V502_10395 [Pseudogymnoascus sp. VKM F-4520 (FW-2644)]|nr:hypothetical protein V502_10395 [Pseudogymnoascus sp. VKM F-4520 (FW-2644)]